MRGLMIGLLFTFLSTSIWAGTWSEKQYVKRTFTEDSDLIIVYTDGAKEYASGCHKSSWSIKLANDQRRGRAYSTVMTALVSGKPVAFWVNTDRCGVWNYHEATAIQIYSE